MDAPEFRRPERFQALAALWAHVDSIRLHRPLRLPGAPGKQRSARKLHADVRRLTSAVVQRGVVLLYDPKQLDQPGENDDGDDCWKDSPHSRIPNTIAEHRSL